jgi:hypothetical protein
VQLIEYSMSEERVQESYHPIVRKGRLSGAKRNRLGRLLNMMYTTHELAAEIGVSARLIRKAYIPLGCPHERNRQNHIMINGVVFRDWYLSTYSKRSPAEDEAFCLACGDAVKMVEPSPRELDGLSYVVARCPDCGRNVARFMDMVRKRL